MFKDDEYHFAAHMAFLCDVRELVALGRFRVTQCLMAKRRNAPSEMFPLSLYYARGPMDPTKSSKIVHTLHILLWLNRAQYYEKAKAARDHSHMAWTADGWGSGLSFSGI